MRNMHITRRRFFQSAAAVSVAPYFIPSTVLGKDGGVAPSNRIAMAHIGVGGQGTYHLQFQSKHKEVQILAVCDADKRHLERARGLLTSAYGSDGGLSFTQDFRELIGRKDIDACLIATPDHWHALTTIAMLKSGKDVYCEKPLTRTIKEGRAVADAAKKYGRVLQTGSHERSNGKARYVADLVRNGYLGKISRVEVNMPVTNHGPSQKMAPTAVPPELDYNMWLGPAPQKYYFEGTVKGGKLDGQAAQRCHFWFRYQLDYATGEMSDRGAHILDLAQLILNKDGTGPTEVSGKGERDLVGEFDAFMKYEFDIKYADGVVIHGTSEGTDDTRGLKIIGSEGWINVHVHGCALTASDPKLLTIKLKPGEESVGGTGENAVEHHANFYNAIRTRGDTVANGEIGHRTVSVCHTTTIALLLGRPLKWDPAKEKFIGDEEANGLLGRTYREPWTL